MPQRHRSPYRPEFRERLIELHRAPAPSSRAAPRFVQRVLREIGPVHADYRRASHWTSVGQ